jgi:hypothetical protein
MITTVIQCQSVRVRPHSRMCDSPMRSKVHVPGERVSHIVGSRLRKGGGGKKHHHQHRHRHGESDRREDHEEERPSMGTQDEEEIHPRGLNKLMLDVKTALYSWLGTGIEPL